MARKGWGEISIAEVEGVEALRRLYESLQGQILEIFESMNAYRDSAQNELHRTLNEQPELFNETVKQYRDNLFLEIQELEDAIAGIEAELETLVRGT